MTERSSRETGWCPRRARVRPATLSVRTTARSGLAGPVITDHHTSCPRMRQMSRRARAVIPSFRRAPRRDSLSFVTPMPRMDALAGSYLRTLFLHPPSYQGFDGGAGARYQARREIRSFWYPTWLAQPAALVPGSRLVDAPPAGLTLENVVPIGRDYDLAVLHTSAASFAHDVRVAEELKRENPRLRIGFVGAHVAVQRERALAASPAIEFVAGSEFDLTIQEVAQDRPL